MAKEVCRSAITGMLFEGCNARLIADTIGCSVQTVYKVARETGHVFGQLGKHRDEIVEQLKSGYSVKGIAKRYGVAAESVRRIRDSIGIERSLNNQWGDYSERLARAICVIEKHLPTFEYAGGFIDTDSAVDLKCKVCGTTKRVSMITVRKGKVECKACKEHEAQDLERRQREEAEHKSLLSTRNRWERLSATATQVRMTFCVCGCVIDARRKRCQDCARKLANKNHENRRRVKLRKAWKDSDISLVALYRRDAGRCWLCGGECDWSDREETRAAIVCGDKYPSIDHVVPLSKGGEHSWENVRLAHRICNSIKSDSNPPALCF